MRIQPGQELKLQARRFSDGIFQRQAALVDPAHGSRRARK